MEIIPTTPEELAKEFTKQMVRGLNRQKTTDHYIVINNEIEELSAEPEILILDLPIFDPYEKELSK